MVLILKKLMILREKFNRNSINKVVLDIYNDANNKNVENVTKFLREKSKKMVILKNL